MPVIRQLFRLAAAAACLGPTLISAQTNLEVQTGFSRIIPGWTNYSTAFNATHDLGADGDFATVASFYTPALDIRPVEYGVIVVWLGSGNRQPDFANFDFSVYFWRGVESFRTDPRRGDLATFTFPTPTGGSTTVPDTITLGGRPAYRLRFSLTNATLTLTQCQTCLVGFSARAGVQQDGELFVPTAPTDGPSDVSAGSLVPFGFTYLINAGGLTLYAGQLATELSQRPVGRLPTLLLARFGNTIQLSWPLGACCYTLETAKELGPPADWSPSAETPVLVETQLRLTLPVTGSNRWFRLAKQAESLPVVSNPP